MRRRFVTMIVTLLVLIALAAPATAGGWATVRLDEEPGEVLVGEPWTFGFMVLQHDRTPNSHVAPRLDAQHRETGEAVSAEGWQEGSEGHFIIEVVFPLAGEWKWGITPEPYAGTSFDTLTVLSASGDSAAAEPVADQVGTAEVHPAHIHVGTCNTLGEVVAPLVDLGGEMATDESPVAGETKGPASAIPVKSSVITVDLPLSDIIEGGHAVTVAASATESDSHIACGDIGGLVADDRLVIGLGDLNDSGHTGVAILEGEGNQTSVSVYLVKSIATADTVSVAIIGNAFSPAVIEITAGTTVTWTNKDAVAHTVTGDDLAFADSSILDEGDSFSQTFDTPGTYTYKCGPHSSMTGTVIVT